MAPSSMNVERSGNSAQDRLIVALDLPSRAKALAMVEALTPLMRWFKVGLELYLSSGMQLVRELKARELQVFLDLKLHDIPNTVAGAVRTITESGDSELCPDLLTLHAAGGAAMLSAAVAASQKAVQTGRKAPLLLGVTVLTSMDGSGLQEVGIDHPPLEQVLRLGTLAAEAGIPGLVCSPHEVKPLRDLLGPGMLLVTPGIRPVQTGTPPGGDDQRRVATPTSALLAGADLLVVGRPITEAPDPAAAAAAILAEMETALGG